MAPNTIFCGPCTSLFWFFWGIWVWEASFVLRKVRRKLNCNECNLEILGVISPIYDSIRPKNLMPASIPLGALS
ncbi:Zinc finger BED domain-containing protein DAYSLEEPER [Fusarium oxysporum f. sp. albedinis]|nr:Zinc finger BED domain-containing protein DAYSLEEPER [Fusarium oxysporum f. sp. albedinis]